MNPSELSAAPQTAASPSLAEVVARLAAEVATPLTQALDRVQALASSGRIDRSGLDALREEIHQARLAGLRGQQIARLVGGQAQPTLERVSLATVLAAALADQAAEAGPLAPVHRPALADLAVMGDASLIHRLLRSAADWAGAAARSPLVWTLDLQPRPLRARLRCQFGPQRQPAVADTAGDAPAAEAPDTLDWLLLQYTAHLAGVAVQRDWHAAQCTLTLEFAHTIAPTGVAEGTTPAPGSGSGLAAGGQVLVLSARREARQLVREALRGHDLFVDYVSTVAAARDYCAEGLPQALIYEAGFAGDALQGLLASLAAAPRTVARVEISPQGQDHEVSGVSASARVGVDGLRHTLAAVLAVALARRG